MYGVILTAGTVDASLMPIFGPIPTGLIPVNGKPIIFSIIENFIKSGIHEIYIGIARDTDYLKKLVGTFFNKKAHLNFVEVDRNLGPGDSLTTIFNHIGSGNVLVNLADTLAPIDIKRLEGNNVVLISKEIDNPERWCLASVDSQTSHITDLHDKLTGADAPYGLVGLYAFKNIEKFSDFHKKSAKTQISDLIKFAMASEPFLAIEAREWLDFGHIDKYQSGKKKMLGARVFNTLNFDDLLGTVTKRSRNAHKLIEEIRWQMNLPNKLKVLFPRIIDSDIHSHAPFITMEYYSYQSVAEIWLYSSFGPSGLLSIIQRVLKILSIFSEYPIPVSESSYKEIYVNKTKQRLDSLREESPLFRELLSLDDIVINGAAYRNWPQLEDAVFARLNQLYAEPMNCLIHGDYCFSNILYDANSGIIRLIDPRGSWGGGMGGDIRYDVAKLRHSICGLYDFIVNDLFVLELDGNRIDYDIFSQSHHLEAGTQFDQAIAGRFDLQEIMLIEGALFMSMIPLHSDNQNRQIMMFCRALELLNRVIK